MTISPTTGGTYVRLTPEETMKYRKIRELEDRLKCLSREEGELNDSLDNCKTTFLEVKILKRLQEIQAESTRYNHIIKKTRESLPPLQIQPKE